MTKRRRFTDEFKAAAVARMEKEETSDILKDLKIGNSVLYKWRLDLKGKTKKLRGKILTRKKKLP